MNALGCPICGAFHWRYQEHVWPRDPKLAAVIDPEPKPPEAPVGMAVDGAGTSSETNPGSPVRQLAGAPRPATLSG